MHNFHDSENEVTPNLSLTLASTMAGHPAYTMKLLLPHLAYDVLVEVTYRSFAVPEALGLLHQANRERHSYASPPPFALEAPAAAKIARTSVRTLLAWVRKGYLYCWQVGSVRFFSPSEVRALGLRHRGLRKWQPTEPNWPVSAAHDAVRNDTVFYPALAECQKEALFSAHLDSFSAAVYDML